jgi:hypothetical protein
MIETIFLTATRVSTFAGARPLTHASGFFFEREQRLFLVTSRHVLIDRPSAHFPDRIEIELHLDERNMTRSTGFSMLLYRDGKSVWLQGADGAGDVDVAVIEIDRAALPTGTVLRAFGCEHLQAMPAVEAGSALLVVGFPLGFHDALHHLPVMRQAMLASAFGLRFQGQGYFLTDARMHRGTSGAPVVMRLPEPEAGRHELPWALLGVHSAKLDVGTRDLALDESLGLNCAWYADILRILTERRVPADGSSPPATGDEADAGTRRKEK